MFLTPAQTRNLRNPEITIAQFEEGVRDVRARRAQPLSEITFSPREIADFELMHQPKGIERVEVSDWTRRLFEEGCKLNKIERNREFVDSAKSLSKILGISLVLFLGYQIVNNAKSIIQLYFKKNPPEGIQTRE